MPLDVLKKAEWLRRQSVFAPRFAVKRIVGLHCLEAGVKSDRHSCFLRPANRCPHAALEPVPIDYGIVGTREASERKKGCNES